MDTRISYCAVIVFFNFSVLSQNMSFAFYFEGSDKVIVLKNYQMVTEKEKQ